MASPHKHEDIKSALRLRGVSLAQIARSLEVAPASVSTVCKGLHRSKRIEAAIAAALGWPVEEVFPERYAGTATTGEHLPM